MKNCKLTKIRGLDRSPIDIRVIYAENLTASEGLCFGYGETQGQYDCNYRPHTYTED